MKKSIFDVTAKLKTPIMVIDLEQLRFDLNLVKSCFAICQIYYAVKSNPDPKIIQVIRDSGLGFEIASIREARTVLQAGVSPSHIVCFHPIKSPELIRYLYHHGIHVMAADSLAEIEKIAACAPGAEVVIRFTVDNEGSIFPLNRKFGAERHEIQSLIASIMYSGLKYAGLTIHVGSQCFNLNTWKNAIESMFALKDYLSILGYDTRLMSLGGGLPVSNEGGREVFEKIAGIAERRISNLQSRKEIICSIEPGRALVAKAGTVVAAVQGVARRARETWVYVDTGIYQGLFESYQSNGAIAYPVSVSNDRGPYEKYTIGGPTCDSADVIATDLLLPRIEIGDRIAFHHTGAYTTCIATEFNGFDRPDTLYLCD